jgi:trigger factor
LLLSEYYVENNVAHITITFDQEEVNKAFNSAYKILLQKMNIPGFRKGFAPYELFKNFVNMERFEEEVSNSLINDGVKYLFEIKKDENYIDFPKIDSLDKPIENEQYTVKMSSEIFPTVEIPEINKLKIDVPLKTNVESIESEKIKSILDANATYLDKEENIKLEDYAIVEHSITSANGTKGKSNTSMVELGKELIFPDTDKVIMSMKKGEEKSIESNLNETDKFTLNLKLIGFKEKILPTLTQELLDNLNVKKDLSEFKNDLNKDAIEEYDRQKKDNGINAIINYLLTTIKIENIPPQLLDSYIDTEINYLSDELKKSGIGYDDFLKRTNKTAESIRKEFTPKAETKLKFDLILKELINKNPELNPDENEVKEKTKEIMGKLKSRKDVDEVESYISNSLAKEKAIEFLLTKFELNYIKEENK